MGLLRLIRLPNLIILLLTLYLITYRVIYPAFIEFQIQPSMTSKEYLLLLFIIACIGAGGYTYNDIIDQKADEANQKDPVVGSSIEKKLAWWVYIFIIIAPLLPLASLIMELHRPDLLWYYLGISGILLIYNLYLKKLPLIGNLTIALLCGAAVYTPYFLEAKALSELKTASANIYESVTMTVLGFTFFAGLSNLIREIVKDQEDVVGDEVTGHRTLPIMMGHRTTALVVIGLCISLCFAIVYWWTRMGLPVFQPIYLVMGMLLVLPLLYFSIRVYRAQDMSDFASLSHHLKIYFGVGLIALFMITY